MFLIGLLAVALGLFGSAGAIGESRRMIIFYVAVTAMIMVTEIIVALFVYCYKTTVSLFSS